MPKKPTIQFILKKSKSEDNSALIMARCRFYKKDFCLSIKESVKIDKWDSKNKRCIIADYLSQSDREKRNYRRINKLLDNLRINYLNIIDGLEALGMFDDLDSCVSSIKSSLEGIVNGAPSHVDPVAIHEAEMLTLKASEFFEKCVEDKPEQWVKRTNTKIVKGTYQNHVAVLKRFKEFLEWSKLADGFSAFDKDFEDKFREYHLVYKQYAPNTFAHSNSILKTWLEKAEDANLIKDKSYHKWQTKAATPLKVYLTPTELDKIYRLNPTDDELAKAHLRSKNLMETRDLFIIAANTGLRYSELTHLNDGTWNIQERTLKIFQQKTHQEVELPLNKQLIELYNKYNGVLPVPIVKSHYNKQVKALVKIAGIDEMISYQRIVGGNCVTEKKPKYDLVASHTARRSFATNMYLALGNASLVMKFTGHKSETTFMNYICLTAKEARIIMQQQYDRIEEYYKKNEEESVLNTLEGYALDGIKLPF